MEFPRQPDPTKITITGTHGDDIYRTYLAIRRAAENHCASIQSQIEPYQIIITCYPFAVND